MDHREATDFLQANQPIPVASDHDQEALDRLGDVLTWYEENPVAEDLPLLIGLVDEADQAGYLDQLADLTML